MNKTIVVNCRTCKEPYVYAGRPTVYGNKFVLGRDGNRSEVIEKYKTYFDEKIKDETFRAEIMKLKGKNIGGFCVPDFDCHLYIIADYLNNLKENE